MQHYARELDQPVTPVLVARYLSPSVREVLVDWDVGYADATGNLRLSLDRPSLFIRDAGALRDPWRGPGRPRGDLKGPTAARIVRGLIDFLPPYSLPELSKRSGASVGATYRMVDFLEEQGLVLREGSQDQRPSRERESQREERGQIVVVEWRRLLLMWSEQFREKAPPMSGYLEPRGLDETTAQLRRWQARGGWRDIPYVATGSLAAQYYAPYAPAKLGMFYAQDPESFAQQLNLRPTDRGANILIAAPVDRVVFDRAQTTDGLRVAAPSQVAADLLMSPGRGPEEAGALMDWMEGHTGAWRR